jgi:hypothetical protein
MTTFTTTTTPARTLPDPAKHVNYTNGMILGVDDFTQEFAYLSAHDRQLARELVGSGRVRGLDVTFTSATAAAQAQLQVAAGLAVLPSGQLVTISTSQCANLDDWLQAHRPDVEAGLGGGAPHSGPLELVVVLGFAECATDDRPVPGEPCRSEADLMAASRLRDDFQLDLRRPPPPGQDEVQAGQAFVAWLRQVPVTATAAGTLAEFLDAIRTASRVGQPGTDHCPAIGDFMATPPPAGLAIPAGQFAGWLRAAFALWSGQLLACWRFDPGSAAAGTDALALAKVTLDVLYDPVKDVYTVDPAMPTAPGPVDQDALPLLLSHQLLQQWVLGAAVPAPSPVIVAAGRFDQLGAVPAPPFFSHGGLTATPRAAPDGDVFDLAFNGFDPAATYVVTGTAVVAVGDPGRGFELVDVAAGAPPAVRLRPPGGPAGPPAGFQLQVVRWPS